jgi:GWxTD domain-containing protein
MISHTRRARRSLAAASLVVLAISASETGAQSSATARADSLIALALERARSGDTSAALRALERATEIAPKHAPAFYQRGMMLARTSVLGLGDALTRRTAWQQINHALDLDQDNPFYLLELGRLRLKTPLLRLEAERLFGRALRAAERRQDPLVLAEVLWELGQIDERRYQSMADRHIITGPAASFDPAAAASDWRYTPDFLALRAQKIPDAGEIDFRKAEDRYRAALVANPAHAGAARGLMALLYEHGRYEEMVRLGSEALRRQNAEPRLWFALGLALHRLDRDVQAEQAFDSALARSTPDDRASVLDLQRVLRQKDAEAYSRLSDSARVQSDSTFWALADPLRLTAANEARVEFLARVAYADLRFSSLEFGTTGWNTDRGTVVLRYGEPPVVATFAPGDNGMGDASYSPSDAAGRVTTVWWYPATRMRFVFVGPPAMNTATFAGEFRAYTANARFLAPLRFDNLEPLTHVDSVRVQVARFRAAPAGPRAGADVLIYADVPTASMLEPLDLAQSTIETGLFITDPRRRDVVALRDSSVVRVGGDDAVSARSWSRQLATGGYVYRVEAREPGSGRSARALATFSVDPFPAGTLSMSDLLIARGIALRPGIAAVRSREDILVRPNGSLTFRRGDTLYVYWENYGVAASPDGSGRVRVDLSLRTDELDRGQSLSARVLGGVADAVGMTAEGENRVALRFDRAVAIDADDRVANYLALDLGGLPYASYTLELTVTDLTTGRQATRLRPLTVPRP